MAIRGSRGARTRRRGTSITPVIPMASVAPVVSVSTIVDRRIGSMVRYVLRNKNPMDITSEVLREAIDDSITILFMMNEMRNSIDVSAQWNRLKYKFSL